MVATVYHWDHDAKLVATRLKGQAYAFYRSCTPQQRASYMYDAMVTALTQRFSPVRIKAVQSSLFHERKQGPQETVDDYAQSLRAWFYRTYPHSQQGSQEAETMGQSVLTYQFVAGLRADIKAKVAGREGGFEELLVKARFEEAKLRDLADPSPGPGSEPPKDRDRNVPDSGRSKCFHCGSTGHFVRLPFSRERRTKGGPRTRSFT